MSRAAVLVVAVLGAAAAAFGWFDVRNRARTDRGPAAHHTDVTVYLAAAQALADGDDPYAATSPRGWRYVYPPLLAIVAQPLTRLPVATAALVVYALSVAALAASMLALARVLGPRGTVVVGAALVACAPFLVQTFQRGQVTVFLLALQVGAFVALFRGRPFAAGLLLAVGIGLRLTPALPAAAVGLACLVRAVRGEAAALRFPGGVVAGLVAVFVVVPVVALGPARAREVTARWLEVGREVYAAGPGALADLGRGYAINEWSFKNQGVRRIAGTTIARVEGLPIDADGRPALGDREADADRVALLAAGVAGLAAVVLALRRLADPTSSAFRAAYAVVCALPAFATRYVYPVHLVVLVPLLVEVARALPARRARAAAVAWVVGLVLFYGAHAIAALRPVAEQGVLSAALVVVVTLVATARPAAPERAP